MYNLVQTGLDVLVEVTSGRMPSADKVTLLRAACPDFANAPVDELARTVVSTELQKMKRLSDRSYRSV